MAPSLKRQSNESIRNFIQQNPNCTHEQVIKELGVKGFSKAHFSTMRWRVRKMEGTPSSPRGKSRDSEKAKDHKKVPALHSQPNKPLMSVDILELVDTSNLSDALKLHYKNVLFPLIRKLHPDGPKLQFVFLADPPQLEIRRLLG